MIPDVRGQGQASQSKLAHAPSKVPEDVVQDVHDGLAANWMANENERQGLQH